MKQKLKNFQNFLSFFYPRCCLGCQKTLLQDENLLCLHCFTHLPETNYHLFQDNPINHTFLGRVKVELAAALLFYKKGNSTQRILYHLKYKGDKEVGEFLGNYYGKKLRQADPFQAIDLILPIPLHPKKERRRGYNQSEWIAKGLSCAMQIPYYNNVLIRNTFTDTQTKKNRLGRWTNVKEVFQVVQPDVIRQKHILLCDDVLTTGATMEAAIIKLLEIEDVKVSVVGLALAQ
jgi:ComF family protein